MKAIDLFAGAGGLSSGFARNGFTISTAVEFDSEIALTFQRNHSEVNLVVDDIREVDRQQIFQRQDADVIIGGPPCQGFSMAGARIRRSFIDDPRNYLFRHYFNIVDTVRPSVFLMENVAGLATMHNGSILDEITARFSAQKYSGGKPYHVISRIVDATKIGIPQTRKRLVIIGSQYPFDIDTAWTRASKAIGERESKFFADVCVADAISNLPSSTYAGTVPNPKPSTHYQASLSSTGQLLHNHTRSKHSAIAIDRMRRVRPGENYTVLREQIKSVHSGAYGRLPWDAPAPTVTTRFDTPAGGRFIHPEEHRTITPREAARLQSFPDNFIFEGSRTSICKQIGNAVPPKLAYFLSEVVLAILNG